MTNWLKEKLGIRSPSRVFAELGNFTMAGLQQGLEKGQDRPLSTVRHVAKQIASVSTGIAIGTSTMPALGSLQFDRRPPISASTATSARAISSGQIVINVYPSTGMNEAQLAQLIARKITEIEQHNAANRRSRYRDND